MIIFTFGEFRDNRRTADRLRDVLLKCLAL
jgi:hypothetical protein